MYHDLALGSSELFAIFWTPSAHASSLAFEALMHLLPILRISLSSETIHSPCSSAQVGPLQSAVGACGPYAKNLDRWSACCCSSFTQLGDCSHVGEVAD
jgi:hypothetical protein